MGADFLLMQAAGKISVVRVSGQLGGPSPLPVNGDKSSTLLRVSGQGGASLGGLGAAKMEHQLPFSIRNLLSVAQ